MFRSLVKLLPTSWAVFGAQLPGRDGRRHEAAQTNLAAYADAIADAVLAMATAETILFGYSFGGNIAFEVAHRLADAGQPVKRLVIAAARAPGVGCPDAPTALRAMPLEAFGELMTTVGLLPAEVAANPPLAQPVLPLMHADLIALHEHALPRTAPFFHAPCMCFLAPRTR